MTMQIDLDNVTGDLALKLRDDCLAAADRVMSLIDTPEQKAACLYVIVAALIESLADLEARGRIEPPKWRNSTSLALGNAMKEMFGGSPIMLTLADIVLITAARAKEKTR